MNITNYLSHQKSEDRRAFIIHYPAGSGKTEFVKHLAQGRADDVFYLDLLAHFLARPGLPPVADIGPKELRGWLLALDVPQSVVIVDNPDFLLNTWSKIEKQNFLHWLGTELRSPADTNKTLMFVIQDDDVLAVANLQNTYGEPRVLALDAFDAL